ncbi:long-chain-fatty-acid--CoA ligase [Brevibacterium litoralis]|uniref:long-chain-fatty-acid--CoA ligase n=1 Tax=Brevibacterium litoralis TaxID=3138935 RepID=UPI0032EBA685
MTETAPADTAALLRGIPSTMGDDHQLNTTTMFRHTARTFPEAEVVHRTLDGAWHRNTYAEEWERVNRAAGALESIGVGPGDVVGVLDWNSRRHLELYWAIPGLAATMLQMNLRLAPEDVVYVAEHARAQYVCVDESLLPVAEAIAAKTDVVTDWIVLSDKPLSEIETGLERVHHYEDLLAAAAPEYPFRQVDERTAYSACYTTGTTGRPKGVYYSHRAIYLHTMGIVGTLSITYDDVVMAITPMFHAQTWGLAQAAVYAGTKLVLPGRFQADDMGVVAEAIVEEGVTVANGAPSLFAPILDHYRKRETPPDLSSARFVSGSTEPPLSLMRGFSELTGADIIHGYGATETTPLVTANRTVKPSLRGWTNEQKWDLKRSQGLPVPGIDFRVRGLDGQDLPHDGSSVGEVQMRGPWITESYHDQPDNAERFDEGWWKTGDVGTITPEGYLKLTDRLKDVIKSGGEWISSIDMENAILDLPNVREAAVIGVPDEKWQERPVAYVVAQDGAEVTREDVAGVLEGRFAKWQMPDRVIVQDALPHTSVGKLDKKALRADWE